MVIRLLRRFCVLLGYGMVSGFGNRGIERVYP